MLATIHRTLALASLALVAGAFRGRAQIPGEPVFGEKRTLRSEYLALSYQEVKVTLQEWRDLIGKRDERGLLKAVTDPVLFSPAEGWRAEGKEALADSMAQWLPTVRGYYVTPVDFDASGNLAYVFATVGYERASRPDAPSKFVTADCLIVLYHQGRRWLVRSYLERPQAR